MLILRLALMAVFLLAMPTSAVARTFYVNPVTGNNAVTEAAAQNPATPVKTVKKALGWALAGDTVLVVVPSPPSPVALADAVTIESKRDGTATAPITIRCQTAGLCTFTPPAATNGFYISHNWHVIDGFKLGGAASGVMGIRFGPHDGTGNPPLFGGIAQNNIVKNFTNNGIHCSKCEGVEFAFNTASNNGQNGIRYQGNGGLIHDNTANTNGGFGIYVVDGANHQLWDNAASGNAQGDIQIAGSEVSALTYYVDLGTGNDLNSPTQAQSSATPWQTIQRALNEALAGDTILVASAATCYAGVESKRDGAAAAPIVLRSRVPGGACIQGGAGSAVLIGHHYNVVEGFEIKGSTNGIQIGPHEVADGVVNGSAAIGNVVHGNSVSGIKFSNVQGGTAAHNVVHDNASEGILYGGSNANILNNLVYRNGAPGSGKYGIALSSGSGHKLTNNTVHGNPNGGLRLGTASGTPVFSTVLNNIVSGSPVGVKEPGGLYTGLATLDFNNVHGNTQNYDLGPSAVGANSISVAPGYVDPGGDDFRLKRAGAGEPGGPPQNSDSPCIDKGSASAAVVGLGDRTAFTDKSPDDGPKVDLGYHGTLITESQAAVTVTSVSVSFDSQADDDGFILAASLAPGPDSNGLGIGSDYVQVRLTANVLNLPVSGFSHQPNTNVWTFQGAGMSGTFTKNCPDCSVTVNLTGSGLSLGAPDMPLTVELRIGDDKGSAVVPVRGSLVFP